jgi:hypothetical protein
MDLKKAWNKATSPITGAAKRIKDHFVFITTKADDDVQRREICGFLGLASITASFFMVTGALNARPPTPSVSEGQTQSQRAPAPASGKEGEYVMQEVMGSILGLAGVAHLGLAAKSHLNLRKKAQKPG